MDDLGEGLRKQRFALDYMLSEGGGNSMTEYFVGGTVTLLLSVIRQNYEVGLFCFIYHGLKVTLCVIIMLFCSILPYYSIIILILF